MARRNKRLIGLCITLFIIAGCANQSNCVAGSQQTSYQACFTPGGNCTNLAVQTISQAKKNIKVQAYGFTSQPIVDALIAAKKRGVDVQILLDKSNLSAKRSEIPDLQANNVPFWIDYKPAIAHNKVILVDQATLITGSFNYTDSAQRRNAENLLVIQSPQLAQQYRENFERRKAQSVTYDQCLQIKKCSHKKFLEND